MLHFRNRSHYYIAWLTVNNVLTGQMMIVEKLFAIICVGHKIFKNSISFSVVIAHV